MLAEYDWRVDELQRYFNKQEISSKFKIYARQHISFFKDRKNMQEV